MKRRVEDLAIFGGPCAFLEPLWVGRPNLGDRERFFDRLGWALDNRWITNGGPLVREFELRVADAVEVRNCVATANATTALQLVLRSLGCTGEVIMPALTFVATPHAASWLGLDVVFCDVDPETATLDPAAVEAALTERTSAIVGVHLWGRPCATDLLAKVASANDVPLILDAAQAFGATSGGRPIGGFGSAEVFSFHATKVVNTFEGGAVVTDDDALAAQIRAMRNFGLDSSGQASMAGVNGKMPESSAAMGLCSLDAFPETVAHNELNHDLYRRELDGVRGVRVVEFDRSCRNNFHYLIVQVDRDVHELSRDALFEVLRAERIMAQRYFWPGCHQMEPYRSERAVELPNTEDIGERVLALPTGPSVSKEDIRRVCDVVALAVEHGPPITEKLRSRGRNSHAN